MSLDQLSQMLQIMFGGVVQYMSNLKFLRIDGLGEISLLNFWFFSCSMLLLGMVWRHFMGPGIQDEMTKDKQAYERALRRRARFKKWRTEDVARYNDYLKRESGT